MGFNLTGNEIRNTYERLVTISGSVISNGTGSDISNLTVTASNATSASYTQVAESASFAVTASYAVNAGTAVSASYASTAGSTISASYAATATSASHALNADNAISASYSATTAPINTIFETVYAGENLTKTDPVYLSGSQGANPIAFKADAGNPAKMPVSYIMNETVAAGNTGQAIALGLIEGINLTGYTAGQEVYVAVGGGWTATRPTGSAQVQVLGIVTKGGSGGKGVVLNPGPVLLPNLTAGNAWVGGANGVPVAVTTSSFSVASSVSSSYALTASYASNAEGVEDAVYTASISDATITFTKGDASTFGITVNNVVNAETASVANNATSASYALTASFAANASTPNLQIVLTAGNTATGSIDLLGGINATSFTGSLLGTASFASNAATATSATTASFASTIASGLNINANTVTASAAQFTNLTATSASFGYVTVTTGSAVIIGDEFIILNADTPSAPFAGIKVYDTGSAATASIEWNGNTDMWITVEENGASAMILTGLSGSKGSEVAPALNKLLKGTGNNTVADSNILDNGTLVTINSNVSASGFVSASTFVGNLTGNAATATSASFATSASSAISASFANSIGTVPSITVSGTGSFGALSVTGPVSGSAIGNNTDTYTSTAKINQIVSLTQAEYNSISASADPSTFYVITDAASFVTSASYALSASYSQTSTSASFASTAATATTASYVLNAVSASFASTANSASFATTAATATSASFATDASTATSASYALNASNAISASYALSASYSLTATSASFASTVASGVNLNNATVSGSFRGDVKPLSIASNTASLDCNTANFFTLTLVSGSNTYINPSNITAGQTINLRVTQPNPGNGTVSFPASVKQVSGSSYIPTTGSAPIDIVTFIAFDNTSLFLSNVKNLV